MMIKYNSMYYPTGEAISSAAEIREDIILILLQCHRRFCLILICPQSMLTCALQQTDE